MNPTTNNAIIAAILLSTVKIWNNIASTKYPIAKNTNKLYFLTRPIIIYIRAYTAHIIVDITPLFMNKNNTANKKNGININTFLFVLLFHLITNVNNT